MVVRRSKFLVSLLAAAASFPLAAQVNKGAEAVPDFAAMEAQELLATLRSSGDRWRDEPCTFGEPLFEALKAKIPPSEPLGNSLALAYVFCADESRDHARGLKKLTALEAEMPDLDTTNIGLYLDAQSDNAESALKRLRALDYEAADEVIADSFWRAARMISAAGRGDEVEDLALEWSKGSIIAAFDFNMQRGVAFRGLAAAARHNDLEAADNLLSYVTSPSIYVTLLTHRKYEPLWPKIEERAGANLEPIGRQNVAITLGRLETKDIDRDRFSEAAHALHYNGQFEDAIALADQWQQREGRGMELEEGDAWALNIQAYAYDSLGQPEKADVIFERLAKVDPDDNNWVVNFVINRASRLVGQGRWEEGLEAAKLARSVPGSTFAELLVARDHTCALKALGRDQEAENELAFIRANSDDGISQSVQALMCHGLNEEAAQLLTDALADPAKRDGALSAFEVDELDLFYTQSVLPNARDLLADHPELAEELAKHMRAMPEAYIPAASLKRAKLDLPEWK